MIPLIWTKKSDEQAKNTHKYIARPLNVQKVFLALNLPNHDWILQIIFHILSVESIKSEHDDSETMTMKSSGTP